MDLWREKSLSDVSLLTNPNEALLKSQITQNLPRQDVQSHTVYLKENNLQKFSIPDKSCSSVVHSRMAPGLPFIQSNPAALLPHKLILDGAAAKRDEG